MDPTRFDRISQLFGKRRLTRREAVTGGLAVGLAATHMPVTAQDATPVASPVAEPGDSEKITYLFVQSFQSGSIAPNADNDLHTLTLEQGLGQTIYFGDRPSRDVGVTPTQEFLDHGLGFNPDNPPNAALIVDAGDGETDLAVLELFAPTYDPATHTATYQVKGLEAWEDTLALGLQDAPTDLSGITPDFGAAHLLIDDCADEQIACIGNNDGSVNYLGDTVGMCYNYAQCMPCTPYGHNQPSACATFSYWQGQCNLASYACPSGACYPSWGNGISSWLGCGGN